MKNPENAVINDLVSELALMHGTLYNLILALRNIEHSNAQNVILDAAFNELKASQKRFFTQYADTIGGTNPEDN